MRTTAIHVFTIGAAGKSAERFFSLLAGAGVKRVIDVRLYNSSQLAGYTKSRDLPFFLKSILHADYLHLAAFAPTKELLNDYKKGQLSWAEYERRYRATIEQRRADLELSPEVLDRSCLLCAEPTADHCHRRLAAEHLQQIWPELTIQHL